MTRSFSKMYGLRAKGKSKMASKRVFSDEDEEEVTEMPHPENLKESARADKIAKEAWAKVMVHRKASALTAAPQTATAPTPAPENTTAPWSGDRHSPNPCSGEHTPAPTPVTETTPTLAPAPTIY